MATNARIEFNIVTLYTITKLLEVGITADTSLRGNSDLPNTASAGGSADTVYLDPVNGSDANDGSTKALSVLTMSKARAQITALSRNTIHIFTTDSNKDLAFTDPITVLTTVPPLLRNLQVEAGHTAVVTFGDGGGYSVSATGANFLEVNGLGFIGNISSHLLGSTGAPPPLLTLEWCEFDNSGGRCVTGNADLVADKCIFKCRSADTSIVAVGSPGITVAVDISNSIFIATESGITAITVSTLGAGTETWDVSFNTYYNCSSVYQNYVDTTSIVVTANHSHVVHRCGTLNKYIGTNSISMAWASSLINSLALGIGTLGTGNSLNQDPLFLDEEQEDFRLAHIGRTVNGANYPKNSPAIGIGSGGKDAGAYDHSYSAAAPTFDAFEIGTKDAYERYSYRPRRSKYQKFSNIKGFSFSTFDFVRAEIDITFASNYWLGNEYSAGLKRVLNSSGLMYYYPNGTDGIISDSAWTFVSLTEIALSISDTMEIDFYKGFIIELTWKIDPAPTILTGYYRILSNTATNLTLEKVRGDQFVSVGLNPQSGKIQYLPVILDMANIDMVSEYFSNDDDNAELFKPWFQVNVAEEPAEFHSRTIKLVETFEESL
jgi:hypothetical protein